MGLATTVLRTMTGATMAGHGVQKLTYSLGGRGPEASGEMFEQMGLTPGRQFAIVTGVAETAGGAMMIAGWGTPLACSMISGVMAGAIAKVHYKNGFWAHARGYEYNLLIMAATFAVAGGGGGPLTLDGLRGKKRKGFGWALAQLAVGVGVAAAALAVAERQNGARSEQGIPGPADAASPGADVEVNMVDLSEQGGVDDHADASA